MIIDAMSLEIYNTRMELNHVNEAYAIMDQEDAMQAETLVNTRLRESAKLLEERQAEAAWEDSLIVTYNANITAGTDPEANGDLLRDAEDRLTAIHTEIDNTTVYIMDLTTQLANIMVRKEDAAQFLAEAEETRAREQMAAQQAEFDEFKIEYNILKAEYDELEGKADAGTLTSADEARMDELEDMYTES